MEFMSKIFYNSVELANLFSIPIDKLEIELRILYKVRTLILHINNVKYFVEKQFY